MQEAKRKYDLTSGDILKKLLLVALPIMGTQLMQMAYNLVDMFFLGRVGSDAVAASGTAGMFMWLSAGLMMVGRMGAEIGVAQCIGRGDLADAERYARNALYLSAGLGLVFGGMLLAFNGPLVGFFAIQEQNVVRDAERYLAIVGVAVPFTYASAAAVGAFNGSGNSRTPFWINGAGLALNIVLDPLFIFGLKQGVIGAAVATAVSQGMVTLAMLLALKRQKARPFERFRLLAAPSLRHMRTILSWSVPVALESMLFTLLSMVTSRLVAAYGAGAIAMTRVGSQIESLSWLVGGGYGSAVTAFVGQNYGARRMERVDRCVRLSMGVMALWGLAVTALLVFAGGALFQVFLPQPELLGMGVNYLRIMAVGQIAMCLEGVAAGAFRGSGQTTQPAAASIASNVLRVVLAYALSLTQLGMEGIFWGVTLSTILRGVWICLWYARVRRRLPA